MILVPASDWRAIDPLHTHMALLRGIESGCSVIRQTTLFDPAGYVGLAYWYLFYPVHHRVFSRMLRGVQRAMRTEGTAATDTASCA